MSSLNKVMIIGRLGRDPEMRYTQAGKPVCSLNVATDEGYTNDRGEKVDKTEWHKVVFWDRQAETCSQYIAKGSLVFVEGRLSTRKYQDQQGQDRYVVDFLGIGDVHGSGVLIKEHGISFVQLEFSLLLQFCHDNRFLS